MSWWYFIFFFAIAAFVCAAMVPFSIWLAKKTGAIDMPSDRRVHHKPMPRMGGVAIFTAIVASVVVAAVGTKYMGWNLPLSFKNPEGVNYIVAGLGAIVMFATGVADDTKCLRPKVKLLMQIVAATITASSGLLLYRVMNPFTGAWIEFGWFSYPLTIFYLVAFTNIINLIDGLDGLSAGICLITSVTIFIFAACTDKIEAAILSLAIAGACFAFLFFNFKNAKLFMGDCGSLTLGFLLGMASLLAVARTAFIVTMIVPILAAGVPIVDTAFAILRRWRSHQPIDQADTGHIHHRLLRSGLTKTQTVLVMWGWTLFLSVCGIIITVSEDPRVDTFVFILALAITVFMVFKLHLFHPVLKHHYNHREKEGRKKRDTKYGLYNRKK